MSNELLPCPFCGGQPSAEVHAEGLHAEGGCERCGWTMEDWSGDLAKLIERMNTRPAPSTRMADVTLWTWTDESNRNPNVYAVRYCGTEMFTTNSANAAKSRCDELNLAATVTLPDAKGCEAKGEHTCGTSHANTPSADRVREEREALAWALLPPREWDAYDHKRAAVHAVVLKRMHQERAALAETKEGR